MKEKEDDKQLLKKVVESFTKAENEREQFEEQWTESYRLYKSKLKEVKPGKANLFIPYTWSTVEQLKARTQLALFTKKPYVCYAGMEPADVEGAKEMEDLVYYQMKDRIKLVDKFLNALTSIYVYGTSIALYSWKTDEKKVKKLQPILENGIQVGEEEVEDIQKIYDDPDIEFIPIDDFYPDPEGYDIDSCAYVITRHMKDRKYLEKMQEQGIYDLPEWETIKTDEGDFLSNFRSEVDGFSIGKEDKNKKYELLSYYTDDKIIVVLNRKYIIRNEDNPLYCRKKPFIRGVAYPQEKCFWGDSIVRIMQSLQEELNSTRNQRIDNISLILSKVGLINTNDDVLIDQLNEYGELEMTPGKLYESIDPTRGVHWIDIPDVTGSAFAEEKEIKQDMQYVSSVSEYARGASPTRKETATTVTTIQEASNTVFNYVISVIENSLLLPIGEAVKQLNQQYMDTEKTVRLFNNSTASYDYNTVTPESIAGAYDVTSASPRFEAEQTKEAKRGQLIETFNLLLSNPITQQFINPIELTKKLLETYDIKDYEKFLVEPQMQGPPMGMDAQVPPQQMQPTPEGMPPQGVDIEGIAAEIANLPPEEQEKALMSMGGVTNGKM